MSDTGKDYVLTFLVFIMIPQSCHYGLHLTEKEIKLKMPYPKNKHQDKLDIGISIMFSLKYYKAEGERSSSHLIGGNPKFKVIESP